MIPASAAGCSGAQPADVLKKAVKAYNDRDVYGIVDCFDPAVQELLDGITDFAGGIAGFNDLSKSLPVFSAAFGDIFFGDEWGEMKFEEIETKKNGDAAAVKCVITIKYPGGIAFEAHRTVNMIKIDKEWYISLKQGN